MQLMINTYKENPEYGNVKKFEQELKVCSEKVSKLDSTLTKLNRELDLLESAMCLNIRHSLISQQGDSYSEGSDGTSHTSDSTDATIDITDDGKNSEDSEEWSDDCLDPPVKKLLALYSYNGEEDGSLMMEAGEELFILEEDTEGWTRVRRSNGEEGFIPTSFTSPITVVKI